MFQPWRVKVRQAEEALRDGQLDEAGRLLCQGDVGEFLPAKRLKGKVARQMIKRGHNNVARGETSAGWRDLETATYLGADNSAASSLRDRLVERALSAVEASLEAGDPQSALARLADLNQHHATNGRTRTLEQVAKHVHAAKRHIRCGKFGDAESEYVAAVALTPQLKSLEVARRACREQAAESRRLQQKLHQFLSDEDWNNVLAASEELLALAPEDRIGRDARRRAWAAVGMSLPDSRRGTFPLAAEAVQGGHGGRLYGQNGEQGTDFVRKTKREDQEFAVAVPNAASRMTSGEDNEEHGDRRHQRGPRFLLWVDAVGGYLVCQGEEITFGQAVGDHDIDVPIQGDLSRIHARMRRSGEGYLIEAVRTTKVNGREITEPTVVGDGDLIELGESVKLKFRRPHALSATVCLDFVSHHRTQPAADGVLLMAESCVLGPQSTSHVKCPDWTTEVVLFGQADSMQCRAKTELVIDGTTCQGGGPVTRRSSITGDEFSLSLEEL